MKYKIYLNILLLTQRLCI